MNKLKKIAKVATSSMKKGNKYFNKPDDENKLIDKLNSSSTTTQMEAVKTVIGNMASGKDVGVYFPHVLKGMQTDHVALKKLIYQYIINYAHSHPNHAILAVNSFVKDTESNDPVLRALAIRTMSLIRVAEILDYLVEPLTRALSDESAYVRKTAVIAVAKLYQMSSELAEDGGFVEMLRARLMDSNGSVAANALMAIQDVHAVCGKKLALSKDESVYLLESLERSPEWFQSNILSVLATTYFPVEEEDVYGCFEKVYPRLQHTNLSVVMEASNFLFSMAVRLQDGPLQPLSDMIFGKVGEAVASLIPGECNELVFVLLKSADIMARGKAGIFASCISYFFLRYEDTCEVKQAKLQVIALSLPYTDLDNSPILEELYKYVTDQDTSTSEGAVMLLVELTCVQPVIMDGICAGLFEFMEDDKVTDLIIKSIPGINMSESAWRDRLVSDLIIKYANTDEDRECRSIDRSWELIWMLSTFGSLVQDDSIKLLHRVMDEFSSLDEIEQQLIVTCSVILSDSDSATCPLKRLKSLKDEFKLTSLIFLKMIESPEFSPKAIARNIFQNYREVTRTPISIDAELFRRFSSVASIVGIPPEVLNRAKLDRLMTSNEFEEAAVDKVGTAFGTLLDLDETDFSEHFTDSESPSLV